MRDVRAGGCYFHSIILPEASTHLEKIVHLQNTCFQCVDVLGVGFLTVMFQVIHLEHPTLDFPEFLSVFFFGMWKTFDVLSARPQLYIEKMGS